MDSLPSIPCLEFDDDIINGMIRVWWNESEYSQFYTKGYRQQIYYEFDRTISHNAYTEWRVVDVGRPSYEYVFYLKVPVLSYQYELSLTFKVVILQYDEEDKRMKKIAELVSKMFKIKIPPFLLQSEFKKDDRIEFYAPGRPWLSSGMVLNILSNGQLVIKSKYDIGGKRIFTVDSSEVVRHTANPDYIADLIDQKAIASDLILKTNDEQKYQTYDALWKGINTYFCWETLRDFGDYIWLDRGDITTAIAWNVYKYLYKEDYQYRFDCLLGDDQLYLEQQWVYTISEWELTLDELEVDIKYLCDLCRKKILLFEYAYFCKYDESPESGHVFCISCIHSALLQYDQMMPFMMKLLNNVLNGHCIEEIVTFCVSKAIRFNQDCTDDEHYQEEDKMNEIEKE